MNHPRVQPWMAPALLIMAGIAALILLVEWIAEHL
jgi:hypothetical protein